MLLQLVPLLFATLARAVSVTSRWHLQDARESVPPNFVRSNARLDPEQEIQFAVNLVMGDRAGLLDSLEKASSPTSATFREWLSKEQVEAFAAPPPTTLSAVASWLNSNSIPFKALTPASDWISFSATASKAGELFNTQFSEFTHLESGTRSIRTLEYSIPSELKGLIRTVYPTTSFSGPLKPGSLLSVEPATGRSVIEARQSTVNCNATITPSCLRTLYNTSTRVATQTDTVGLGIAGFSNQFANIADLNTFFQLFNPNVTPTSFTLTSVDNGTNSQVRSQAGTEANLDIQYTVGIANGVPSTFVSVGVRNQDGDDGGFLDIITALLGEDAPPLVLTTSYGFDTEDSLSFELTDAMCDAYLQLTSRGVSILFASGDGGVASTPGVQCNTTTGFRPTFPSCPFATLVGATQNVPEMGAGLSAGGFSNYFPQQTWQADAVNAYLKTLGQTNAGLFNASGRAYPDVSAQGRRVQVVINNVVRSISGTSCSSPIFASGIADINDELLANGKNVLGFLNPFLYANPGAFNDITTGNNPGCGTQGFPAAAGWDPVTGMGTPNFAALRIAAGLS